MTTGQKIYESRRKAGLTQEELADRLGVSRQAVSKWESDAAFPETEKILELCKLFSLSADELLFGQSSGAGAKPEAQEDGKGVTWGRIEHTEAFHYEYISKKRVFGLPLLHVNFGLGFYRAKGIFAFGNFATGFFSYGFLSIGLIAAGFMSLGLLAFGGVAVGVMTFGGLSIGYVAVGGAAIGQYAIGGWAQGWLAVGNSHAFGEHAFVVPAQFSELEAFLDARPSLGWLGGFVRSLSRALNG